MTSRATNRVKKLTVSALLVALGVIFLYLGSLLDVLDLSTAVLASLLVAYAVLELHGAYPVAIWLATSLLGLLLLPQKSPALAYALFAGYYPALKALLEQKLPRVLSWLVKLLVLAAATGLFVLLLSLVWPAELQTYAAYPWLPALLCGLALLCFFLYDFALTRLILVYYSRFQKYIGLDRK